MRARLAVALLAALPAWAARAEDPLAFTVRPSGLEGVETLDQKLARRDRFRFICIGCVRAAGEVATEPFEPIRTLNSPELTAALRPGREENPAEP